MSLAKDVTDERMKRLMAMGEMAATLAHEIRNPLGSMELFCSLLKQDLQGQPDLLYLAEQIHKGIRTLEQVIANSLQFVRDRKPQAEHLERASEIAQAVVEQVKPNAEEQGISLSCRIHKDGAAELDRHLVSQVLLNLLLNAVDAVVARAERIQGEWDVELALDLTGETVSFVVSDRGIGIDEAVQAKIFDPFFSTKQKGTGLGLAVVYSIVKAHGGEVSIESQIGRGTKFTVTLPRWRQQSESQHAG